MTRKRIFEHLPLLLVIAAALLVYLLNFNLTLNDDEASFLYYAWRVAEGDVMYRDFSAMHLPPVPLFMALLFKLLGPSAWLAKFATMIVSVANVGLVYLIGKEIEGPVAGLLSAALYLFAPESIYLSSVLLLEPWFLLALLTGLWFQTKAEGTGKLRLYLAAGIAYGASIHMKLLALIPIGGILLWFVVWFLNDSKSRLFHRKRILAAFGLVCLGVAATILFAMFYRLTIGEFYHSPHLTKFSFWEVWRVVSEYFEQNVYVTVLSILGLPLALNAFWKRDRWLVVASYCSSVLLFFVWPRSPFHSFFLTLLTPGFSLLAGGVLWHGMRKMRYDALRAAAFLVICCFAGGGFLASRWKPSWRVDMPAEALSIFHAGRAEDTIMGTFVQLPSVVQFVREHTTADDYILADFGYVPFFARRRNVPLPYDLHNATVNRISLEEYEQAIERYKPAVVVIGRTSSMTGHLSAYRRIGELLRYLEGEYEHSGEYSTFDLYVRKS